MHQLLGEDLARFYLGGLFGGAENLHPPNQEPVGDARRQRGFGPDHGEVNSLFLGCFKQGVYIGGLDVEVLGNLGRARVARGGIDFLNFGALSQLPDQGMLPPPAADDQYLYLPHPLISPSPIKERGRNNL